jgi:hypothetical protein
MFRVDPSDELDVEFAGIVGLVEAIPNDLQITVQVEDVPAFFDDSHRLIEVAGSNSEIPHYVDAVSSKTLVGVSSGLVHRHELITRATLCGPSSFT